MQIYAKCSSLCTVWSSTTTLPGLSCFDQSMVLSGLGQLHPACVPDSSWHSKETSFSVALNWLSHWAKRAILRSQTFRFSIKDPPPPHTHNNHHQKHPRTTNLHCSLYIPQHCLERSMFSRIARRRQSLHRCWGWVPNSSLKWLRYSHFSSFAMHYFLVVEMEGSKL